MSHYVTKQMVRFLQFASLDEVDAFIVGRSAWEDICEDLERNSNMTGRPLPVGEIKKLDSVRFMDVPVIPMRSTNHRRGGVELHGRDWNGVPWIKQVVW